MMARHRTSSQESRLSAIVNALPLVFTYSVVTGSWSVFGICVVINDTFVRRSDTGRFIWQSIILNALFGLTILSLLTASSRSPGRPDPSLTPNNARKAAKQEQKDWVDDDDDIPLGQIRGSRLSPLQLDDARMDQGVLGTEPLGSGSSGFSAEVSPFPLKISPFVPSSATEAGEDLDEENDGNEGYGRSEEEVDLDLGDSARLLERGDEIEQQTTRPGRRSLFAKNSSGGVRWCKKCDGWKPDRCHHCRQCRRCTLKMDHHCVWIGTCVGYHNYKPFLLFITYGTLLAFYIFIESILCTIRYFSDPADYASHTPDSMQASEIVPVTFMLLSMIGGFFTMTIGGLAGYHWYLVCNNKTTLEEITHSYPTALIEDQGPSTGDRIRWRSDELLTRPERVRLRNEASSMNVYDLGWRNNVRTVLLPPSQKGVMRYIQCLWPMASTRDRHDAAAGHYFPYDETKLRRLRELTAELRLGQRRSGARSSTED